MPPQCESQTRCVLKLIQVDDDALAVHVGRRRRRRGVIAGVVCRDVIVIVSFNCSLRHGREFVGEVRVAQLHVLLFQQLQLHVEPLELVLQGVQ